MHKSHGGTSHVCLITVGTEPATFEILVVRQTFELARMHTHRNTTNIIFT
jgi:hypothetical protein